MDHPNFNAVAFVATSAEYRAICEQTYQLARYALFQRLESGLYQNPCVVMDLDETVLDNTAYQAWLIYADEQYSTENWNAWCYAKSAGLIPGALDFINFARNLGVAILFITSREDDTRDATVDNLVSLNILDRSQAPDYLSKEKHESCLFMDKMAGFDDPLQEMKFEQRQFIQRERGFEIILSIGDSLSDYASYYKKSIVSLIMKPDSKEYTGRYYSATERRLSADQDIPQWGSDFIVIPNPTYGVWLSTLTKDPCTVSIGPKPQKPDPINNVIPCWQGP